MKKYIAALMLGCMVMASTGCDTVYETKSTIVDAKIVTKYEDHRFKTTTDSYHRIIFEYDGIYGEIGSKVIYTVGNPGDIIKVRMEEKIVDGKVKNVELKMINE